MAKAALIAKGKQNYMDALNRLGGALAYRECGAMGGMDTALCLKGLKTKLTETDWADTWEYAMERPVTVIVPILLVPIELPEERVLTMRERELLIPRATDTEKQRYWKERYERLGRSERIYREREDSMRLKEIMTRREKLLTLLKLSYGS